MALIVYPDSNFDIIAILFLKIMRSKNKKVNYYKSFDILVGTQRKQINIKVAHDSPQHYCL